MTFGVRVHSVRIVSSLCHHVQCRQYSATSVDNTLDTVNRLKTVYSVTFTDDERVKGDFVYTVPMLSSKYCHLVERAGLHGSNVYFFSYLLFLFAYA